MPSKRKNVNQSKEEHLKSTKASLDEAKERLELTNMSKEEEQMIREKNQNREDMIADLEIELEDGYDEEP